VNIHTYILPETDAQLVTEVAVHDPELARKVQLRFRSLRLRCVVSETAEDDWDLRGPRHSVWHSLRWPWRQRG
jgi:hypothetical protein